MSTENKKKVLLGFGAFAVVLIAALAIWRPPAFRSEDASGSIGAVQKHHAPQITPQDVILGDETTKHEQQIRYADFLNDAAKLHSLSAKLTANNADAASRGELDAMKAEVAGRWQTEAKAAVDAARALSRNADNRDALSRNADNRDALSRNADNRDALSRNADNRKMDANVEALAAILANGQLSDAQMESFNRKLAAFTEQAGVKTAAERAQAARKDVDAFIALARTDQAGALVAMQRADAELKAIGAFSLMDRADTLKAIQAESRGLDRDIDTLGKMSSRPIAENQAAARAFDGTASQLEMMAAKAMDLQLGLLVVVASALRDIDANITAARGAAQASVAGRSEVYEKAYQAFAGTKADLNSQLNAGINAELYALNNYLDSSATQAGARTPELKSFMANLSHDLNANTALAGSLSDRNDLAMRAQRIMEQKTYDQKNAAAKTSY